MRSGERTHQSYRGRLAAGTLILSTTFFIGLLSAGPAAAEDPTPSVTTAPGTQPDAQPAQAPVLDIDGPAKDIVAPVKDITFSTADLRHEARVEKRPKQLRVTLDSTVLFGKDSAKINGKAGNRLADISKEIKEMGAGKIDVTGYTDDLGTAEHGLKLSKARAEAVAKALRKQLSTSTFPINTIGKGEADPAVPNDSEAHRKVNRRVVINYRTR